MAPLSDAYLKEMVQKLWDHNFTIDREKDIAFIFTENDINKEGLSMADTAKAKKFLIEIRGY